MSAQAIRVMQECLKTKKRYLDLGNCGLTDNDFAEGNSVDKLLRQCTHLEILILSNNWVDPPAKKHSKSKGNGNKLNRPPGALKLLKTLSTLICAGEIGNEWGIDDISFVAYLTSLTILNVSHNQVRKIEGKRQCFFVVAHRVCSRKSL